LSDPVKSKEAELLHICRRVIDSENISVTDNLIQAGADSLDLIRIVAQASQLGHNFSVKHLLSFPTVRQIASLKPKSEISSFNSCLDIGKIMLAPMQEWFFKLNLEFPEHWNQIRMFPIDPKLSDLHLFQAGQLIVDKHTLLRTGFRRVNSGWEGFMIQPALPIPYEVIGDAKTSRSTHMESLRRRIEIAHGTFNLDQPPLAKLIRVRNHSSASDLLCLITHHLISDNISLDILQHDLEDAFNHVLSQKSTTLPYSSDSYYSCVRSITGANIEAQKVKVDKKFDLSELTLLYKKNLERDCQRLVIEIPDIRNRLDASAVLDSMGMEALIIAGLLGSLSEMFHWPFVVIDIGYHGRGSGDDVTKMVGWFATFSPVLFELNSNSELNARQAEVQQSLLGIRTKSKRLNSQCAAVMDYCPNGVSGWVSFDFMGNHSNRNEALADVKGDLRHPNNTRPYILEVIARLNSGSLEIMLKYPGKAYSEEQMNKLLHVLIKDHIGFTCDSVTISNKELS